MLLHQERVGKLIVSLSLSFFVSYSRKYIALTQAWNLGLMEEKGLHPNGGADGHANGGHTHDDSGHHHKEKTSLKTRIKAKLHRNPAMASS